MPTTQTFDHNYTASYYLHELRTPESYRGDNYSDAGGGCRQIISMARAAAIPIEQLHLMNENQREILVQRIAHEYWEHALWQERDFPRVFPFVENAGKRVGADRR
ncbi:isopentenyl transferase family protein [Paracidovorax citrulli]